MSDALCGRGWAGRCATATSKKCTCQCGGKNHGIARTDAPATDPIARGAIVGTARARFSLVSADAAHVTLRDLGPWDKHPTITNDVEQVVLDVVASGLGDRRLFYFDSGGRRDEIIVVAGKFARFAPGMANSAKLAVTDADYSEGVRRNAERLRELTDKEDKRHATR